MVRLLSPHIAIAWLSALGECRRLNGRNVHENSESVSFVLPTNVYKSTSLMHLHGRSCLIPHFARPTSAAKPAEEPAPAPSDALSLVERRGGTDFWPLSNSNLTLVKLFRDVLQIPGIW